MKIYLPACKLSDMQLRTLIQHHGRDVEVLNNTADPNDSYALHDFIDQHRGGFVYASDPVHIGSASAHRMTFGVFRLDADKQVERIVHLCDRHHDYVVMQIWPREVVFEVRSSRALH